MLGVCGLIVAVVTTWTVQTKSSVSGDKSLLPAGAEVTYRCTYQKGDVRKGDTATLSLQHLGGVQIEAVDVYMKSNKSSGAGELSVFVNGVLQAFKDGTYWTWTGTYDNKNSHSVSLLNKPMKHVDDLQVQVVGTTNSLHIEKYVITYTPAPVHSVQLMTGSTVYGTLTETQGGAGVVLPQADDQGQWLFAGWSESQYWTIEGPVHLWKAGTTYAPQEHETLWAAYCYAQMPDTNYMTDIVSGEYLYVNRTGRIALTGTVVDGIMDFAEVDLWDDEQRYYVEFVGNDTAYITHSASGTPIGYTTGPKMAATASPWKVYHEDEQTLFYTTISGKNYLLWLNIPDSKDNSYLYAGLLQQNPGSSPMRLVVPTEYTPLYTCHPEAEGIEVTSERMNELTNERVIRLGIYELTIKNGRKELRIEN